MYSFSKVSTAEVSFSIFISLFLWICLNLYLKCQVNLQSIWHFFLYYQSFKIYVFFFLTCCDPVCDPVCISNDYLLKLAENLRKR